MSWQTDDGQHEGYAAPLLHDMRRVQGWCRDGYLIGDDVVPYSVPLLGFQAQCSCGWTGPMWLTQHAETADPTEETTRWNGSTCTIEDAVHAVWKRQHLDYLP